MKNRTLRVIVALILVACMAYSAYNLLTISNEYARADEVQREMFVYKPPAPQPSSSNDEPPSAPALVILNQSIIDAQNEINADIVGWLTIPRTNIDYLFVQAGDNDFYLRRDLYKQQLYAGSIFMESRNSKDFSDFNTILYGHNMKNGSMFHNLRKFAETDFFEGNQTGTIYLADRIFTLRIFAYLVIQADNEVVYQNQATSWDEKERYFTYVRDRARQYREIDLTEQDRVVTLSTCAYEYDDARMVLVARLDEQTGN